MSKIIALGICLALVGTATQAQTVKPVGGGEPDHHSGTPLGQFALGSLVVTPTFKIGTLAIDTNVQYERQKTTDFIASAGPGLDLSLPFHDQWKFEVGSSAQYLYFLRTEQLRRWTGLGSATLYWKGTGTRAQAAFGYNREFSRPSYEVNTRVARTIKDLSAEVERDLGRLTLAVRGLYGQTRADDGQSYRGTDISSSLTTNDFFGNLDLRYSLTPVTSLVLEGGYKETHFPDAAIRNFAEENGGAGLKTTGIFNGQITAGLRRTHLLTGSISRTRPYLRANMTQKLNRRISLTERYDNNSSVSAFARDGFLPTYENRQLAIDLRIMITNRIDTVLGGTRAHNISDGEIRVLTDSGEVAFAIRDDLVYDAHADIGIRLARTRLSGFVSYTTRHSVYFSDFGIQGLQSGLRVEYAPQFPLGIRQRMSSIFQTKTVDQLLAGSGAPGSGMKRTLTTFDLVMLGIGAVIGAGIFSSIGTAAVGETAADGTVIRYGAGPALTLSFVLLGAVCALAGLCYAELTAMIPVSGSAYTYAYATLGELVAWIIGWDLILEYAVGNVAVAIAWSGYFASFLRFFGIEIPYWLCHSYRDVALSYPEHLDKLPLLFGHHIAINIPAIVIVGLITWLLVIGVKESARVNNVMVALKLSVLALFIGVGFFYIKPENWVPFAPNGWRGVMNGAAIVFFAYIGFDAISTAAEETIDPQRSMPRGILWSLAICTIIYVIVGGVATGIVPYQQLKGSDPLARAFELAGIGWGQVIISFGAIVSMSAVLLVFQYGQPRIFYSMSRDGLLPPFFRQLHPKYQTPHITTIVTGILVALGSTILDDDETYDLTNIGTLFAFLIVCLGVLALRMKDPGRPRPFRVPLVWVVAPLGAAGCLYTMYYLPTAAWERFGIWLLIGAALYFAYGRSHSILSAERDKASPKV